MWDVVFGTRHAPAGERPSDEVGVRGVEFPESFLGQLATPFLLPGWTAPVDERVPEHAGAPPPAA